MLTIDREQFARHFPAAPFLVQHSLQLNPLFQIPRLLELSTLLPEHKVEYNAGNLPVSQDPTKTPRNGLSVAETIQRIAECKSWLVLKNVEVSEPYKLIIDQCLDQVCELARSSIPVTYHREGFIFISSPGSVTPYHTDPEHNFLLQIQGSKTVHLFDGADRSIITEEELENFHSGGHRNLTLRDDAKGKARSFTLTPGVGLHFPVNDPHWVQNGEQVSVSLSITFRSPLSDRKARLHFINGKLRNFGIAPSPVGASAVRDLCKDVIVRSYQNLRWILGGRSSSADSRY